MKARVVPIVLGATTPSLDEHIRNIPGNEAKTFSKQDFWDLTTFSGENPVEKAEAKRKSRMPNKMN